MIDARVIRGRSVPGIDQIIAAACLAARVSRVELFNPADRSRERACARSIAAALLRDLRGMSQEETARALGCATSAARRYALRAAERYPRHLRAAQGYLGEEDRDPPAPTAQTAPTKRSADRTSSLSHQPIQSRR